MTRIEETSSYIRVLKTIQSVLNESSVTEATDNSPMQKLLSIAKTKVKGAQILKGQLVLIPHGDKRGYLAIDEVEQGKTGKYTCEMTWGYRMAGFKGIAESGIDGARGNTLQDLLDNVIKAFEKMSKTKI